jgi:hypothetical protein
MARTDARYAGDEQFLRRAFDTAYQVTPENFRNFIGSIPRRVKWMIVTTLAALVLVLVLLQLTRVGIQAIEWVNRPPLMERIQAPYDLEARLTPNVAVDSLELAPIPFVDSAALAEKRALALEEAWAAAEAEDEQAAALVAAEAEAQEAVVEGQAVADGEALTDGEIAGAAEEAAPAALEVTIDEEAILASIQPEVDPAYFVVLPALENYARTYVYDNITTHPAQSCLVILGEPTEADEGGCQLSYQPRYIEAADYTDGQNHIVRLVVARFESPAEARESMVEMHEQAWTTGSLGNYALVEGLQVNYFFAQVRGWQNFTWSNGSWVYSIAAPSFSQLEAFIGKLTF